MDSSLFAMFADWQFDWHFWPLLWGWADIDEDDIDDDDEYDDNDDECDADDDQDE